MWAWWRYLELARSAVLTPPVGHQVGAGKGNGGKGNGDNGTGNVGVEISIAEVVPSSDSDSDVEITQITAAPVIVVDVE